MIVGNEPELPKPEKSSRGLVVRAELVIATLALVASACASIAAILQTRKSAIETQATLEQTKIVSKQLGSSLWPYLSFAHSLSPTSVKIGFTNDGLGPALIRSFTIVLDDRPITRLHSVIDLVDPKTRGRRVGESDFGRSSVLRPSEGLTIISISDPRFNDTRAERGLAHARFDVCYCSLLDDCWSLRSTDTEPHSIRDCPRQSQPLSL